jgi:hypothetical protein
MRAQRALAVTRAQTAIAVPLREAAAGAGTEHEDFHGSVWGCGRRIALDAPPTGPKGSAIRDVHRDLEAEAQIFEGGLRPLHESLLERWGEVRAELP